MMYPVSRDVGDVKNNERKLIDNIDFWIEYIPRNKCPRYTQISSWIKDSWYMVLDWCFWIKSRDSSSSGGC
jgi:hypothetical protein